MNIKQTVTLNDETLEALTEYFLKAEENKKRRVFLAVLGALIVALSSAFLIDGDFIYGAVICVAGVFFIVYSAVLFKLTVRKNIRRMNEKRFGTDIVAELDEDGIRMDSSIGRSELNWQACDGFFNGEKFVILIFVNKTALLLDKSRLSDEEISWLKARTEEQK